MRNIGFSTGALALGDFRRALDMLGSHHCNAVELSALRDSELPTLMRAADGLDLQRFRYVSVHAPSRYKMMSEAQIVDSLLPCVDKGWHVVIHPDAIELHSRWRPFGKLLCLENMDKRKPSGRTAEELAEHFDHLPEASLCLDLGHARQVDSTFGVAREILRVYGDRLAQLHLSELDAQSHHQPLSMTTVWAVKEIARLIPDASVILESMVEENAIAKELKMATECFASIGGITKQIDRAHTLETRA